MIVGAGASGCFCAAQLHEALPGADIRIVEAGPRPLAKLSVTGGGRCNITNDFTHIRSLEEAYPRGAKLMKKLLYTFSHEDLLEWFRRRGAEFVIEDEGRIFPASGDAMQIVDILLDSLRGVDILCNRRLSVLPEGQDCTVVTTGGGRGMEILAGLPVETVPAVPSLFTFYLADEPGGTRSSLTSLNGISQDVSLSLPGTSIRSEGKVLITDWGLSGPAALRLSSYAARELSACGYRCPLQIRWLGKAESDIRSELCSLKKNNPAKKLVSVHPEGLCRRIWDYILQRCSLRPEMLWAELGIKGINRLCSVLACDSYYMNGRFPFRGEFVTCGGVSLSSVHADSLECKSKKGLFFAGEILDVDAVTGGFNLQAAWSTAYTVAQTIISRYGTKNF